MADATVKYRRGEFEKLKKEHKAKPKHERIPHYLDSEGNIKPYSQQELNADRDRVLEEIRIKKQ